MAKPKPIEEKKTAYHRTVNFGKEDFEYLDKNYPTISAGVQSCVAMMRGIASRTNVTDVDVIIDNLVTIERIRLYSLLTLKKLFTPKEWMFIKDSLHNTVATPDIRCNLFAFIAHVKDSASLDGLDEKYEVNMDAFVEKLNNLNGAQIDAIYYYVAKFWENPSSESKISD